MKVDDIDREKYHILLPIFSPSKNIRHMFWNWRDIRPRLANRTGVCEKPTVHQRKGWYHGTTQRTDGIWSISNSEKRIIVDHSSTGKLQWRSRASTVEMQMNLSGWVKASVPTQHKAKYYLRLRNSENTGLSKACREIKPSYGESAQSNGSKVILEVCSWNQVVNLMSIWIFLMSLIVQ